MLSLNIAFRFVSFCIAGRYFERLDLEKERHKQPQVVRIPNVFSSVPFISYEYQLLF